MPGLLDYYFNPQSYGGGLLNMPNVPLEMPGAGFGQADQMSARQAMPMNVATQMPQQQPQQMPQMQQQQPQSVLGGISSGLANNSNMLMAMGAGLLSGEGFGGGLKNAMVGSKLDREQRGINATEKALAARGLPPEIASVVARNPTLLAAALKRQVGGGTFGLNPIYGKNEKGETVLLQTSDTGEAVQTKLPEGVSVSTGVDKVDLGTQWMFRDKKTGSIVGYAPKDVAGKKEQEAFGKGRGEAKLILPQTKTAVESAFRAIDNLRNHPGIDIGTGLSSSIDPRSWTPGQPGYDFIALNKQAQGKAFMAAREALKGAGQVTDFEGTKGEQAITNLDTAQSKAQYLKALDELERMLKASYEDLQKKAGVSARQQPMTPTRGPTNSGVVDYRTYFGGQ